MKWILILTITFTAAFSAAECVHVTQSEFEEAKKELLEIDPPIDVDTTLRQRMDACHEMCVKDYVPDTVCLFKTDKKRKQRNRDERRLNIEGSYPRQRSADHLY